MKKNLKQVIVKILFWQARKTLERFNPKIISITGSVGKTSTKDAVTRVLSSKYKVRGSQKSYNSEIGVPLTILGFNNPWTNPFAWILNLAKGFYTIYFSKKYPDWLVLEVGVDRPGDMERALTLIKSDVVVITAFPDVPVHVEHFLSPQEVIEEKKILLRSLKRDGILVLNHDDSKVLELQELSNTKTLTYGFDAGADINASNKKNLYKINAPAGTTFKVNYSDKSFPVNVYSSLGDSLVYAVLAAVAVGASLDVNMIDAIEAIKKYKNPPGRMRIIRGLKDAYIIDDSYNSSPVATYHALNTLRGLKTEGRKIAVLGDMAELGTYSEDEHKSIGKYVSECADMLITVGYRARDIAVGALQNSLSEKNILQYENSERAGKELELKLQPGDLVLVKGSQSIRMEKVVEEIMANPEDKKKLLARQSRKWLKKEI